MLAKITMKGRKRGELFFYDSAMSWRPSWRALWLTLFNGDDVVLHVRESEIDDIQHIN